MSEKVICNYDDLAAIADATRSATGSTETYSVPELSAAAVDVINNTGDNNTSNAVLYIEQILSEEQKAQARENIGIDETLVIFKDQGSSNVGKILMVGSDGKLILGDMLSTDGDITGVVDDSNNIILSGDLADGTYTLKYQKADGTYIDAGELVVSSIGTYAIICNLTNCTSSGADTIRQGGTATITITANEGYNLPGSITVSGAEYTWDKINGQIALSNPTSDVTITVAAVTYTNLADPTSSDWLANTRFGSDGGTRSYTGAACTNYIAVSQGDVVRVRGMDMSCGTVLTHVNMYKADGTVAWAYALNGGVGTGGQFSAVEVSTTEATVTSANAAITHLRFSGILNGAAEDVIITVNEPIE